MYFVAPAAVRVYLHARLAHASKVINITLQTIVLLTAANLNEGGERLLAP